MLLAAADGPDQFCDDLPDPADLDHDYFRLVLRQLIDAGVAVVQAISYDATAHTAATVNGDADPRDATVTDLAIAYERTARAVRRTVALARRLNADAKDRTARSATRAAARKRIARAVEDTAEDVIKRRPLPDHLRAELHADLHERLADPALDHDILTRPISEIIADICRDLGLATAATVHRQATHPREAGQVYPPPPARNPTPPGTPLLPRTVPPPDH